MENFSNNELDMKISKDLDSMLVYYTTDIGESEQNSYLKELLEEIRSEMENSFTQIMKNIYNPRLDIQQKTVLPDDTNREELDFFARKLLLLDRSGIQLDLNLYMPLAVYFLLTGYHTDALDVLIRNLEFVSNYELALNILSVIFFKYDKKDESLEVLEEAIRNGAEEDIIYYNAALLYYMIGDYDKAVNHLEGREDKLTSRSNFYLCFGDSLYNIGDRERSALYFEKYLYKNTQNMNVISKLIDIYYDNEEYSKALKYLNIFESNDGDLSNMIFKKAVSLYFTENYNDAMLVLARMLGIERKYLEGKGRDYLFGLFVESFRMGLSDDKVFKVFRNEMELEDWDTDMVDYLVTQVKNIKVDDPGSLCFLGILYKQTGNIKKAHSIFEEVIKLDPGNTEAMNWLGVTCYELKDTEKTIKIYQGLLLDGRVGKELSYIAAKIYIDREDMHNAKHAALYSYEKGIKTLEILKMIGYIFVELKELDNAYEYYLKAQKLNPHDLEIQNQMGVVHLLSGKYNDAALIFKRIVKKDPSFGEAHYNLGITYKKILEEESQNHIKKFYELSGDKKEELVIDE